MSTSTTAPTDTEERPARQPVSLSAPRGRRFRLYLDRAGRVVVGLGGVAIVAVILAILLVLLIEVAPLFQGASARLVGSVTSPRIGLPARIGVDEYRELAYLADARGVTIISLKDGSELAQEPVPLSGDDRIDAVSEISRSRLAFFTARGKIIFCELRFEPSLSNPTRKTEADALFGEPIDAAFGQPVRAVAYVETKDGQLAVASVGNNELVGARVTELKTPEGSTFSDEKWRLTLPGNQEISALALNDRGEDLFVGTSDGRLALIDLRNGEQKYAGETVANDGIRITALNLLIGHRTLIVGDAQGNVSSWQILTDASGERRLRRIHDFTPQSNAVAVISPSNRDKGFLTGDEKGVVQLHYGTTGRTRLRLVLPETALRALAYAPRADGFVALGANGVVHSYELENHHPEITLASLFGKVWYEGNPQPDHTWQSTGGSDDSEAKFGLMPLIYGTLKGSFYTLLFAVPVAILAALYASQFMHPRWKNFIKPAVEIMAGLPSVVVGFIAALWLAPNIEKVLPGILLMPLILPAFVLLTVILFRVLPSRFRAIVKPGRELIALIPVLVLGIWVSLRVSDALANHLMGGDYHSWLSERLGLAYDQRNSLVVCFAMGFAVIPVIFTIAEDAFSNVPRHLVLAARSLGANKWQTSLRVVLPTASPGIFSAIMVGLGRAVGETMIVLMATGNTPIMNWNIFNGFRALSANIAVELPEAPAGGTLFRVLFLTALLLFVLTFIVNTAAELVRLRLRKRYSLL